MLHSKVGELDTRNDIIDFTFYEFCSGAGHEKGLATRQCLPEARCSVCSSDTGGGGGGGGGAWTTSMPHEGCHHGGVESRQAAWKKATNSAPRESKSRKASPSR